MASAPYPCSDALDLVMLLRRYGFLGLDPQLDPASELARLGICWPTAPSAWHNSSADRRAIVGFLPQQAEGLPLSLQVEPAGEPLFARPRSTNEPLQVQYRTLFSHVSFAGPGLEPIWQNSAGRAALAWYRHKGQKILLVGLDVVRELIRYTQGVPGRVDSTPNKSCFSFNFERANYLFTPNLSEAQPTIPWADRLGFQLARLLARATGQPLVSALPGNLQGLVVLTGDDDQAPLPSYREQLEVVGGFPITYYLVLLTRHGPATLQALPPSVDLGAHVDALDEPNDYDRICALQCQAIRALTDRPLRSIRNHGYLNRGYLGHLRAWENCGLEMDANYAGLNGTALNGSFLPYRVRRPDRSWSNHFSLLTAFGDGMLSICRWSERQAIRRIQELAKQIESETPGMLVFNMHPANIRQTRQIHQAIMKLGNRPGWQAIGMNALLDWLQAKEAVTWRIAGKEVELTIPRPIPGLTLLWPRQDTWVADPIGPAVGNFTCGVKAQAA